MVRYSFSFIPGHLVSRDKLFKDWAEINIFDRAISADKIVVHIVLALADSISSLEIRKRIMNTVACLVLSLDKLDLVSSEQR